MSLRSFVDSSQPNVRTIEGVLFDALVRAGAVSNDNADDPTKVLPCSHPLVVKLNAIYRSVSDEPLEQMRAFTPQATLSP